MSCLPTPNPSDCRFGALKFDYTDPVPNFDRKLVHGVLAKLVTPRNLADCTALEAAAGGVVSLLCLSSLFGKLWLTDDTKEGTNAYSLLIVRTALQRGGRERAGVQGPHQEGRAAAPLHVHSTQQNHAPHDRT